MLSRGCSLFWPRDDTGRFGAKYNGMPVQVLQVGKGARVASIMSLGEFSDDDFLVMLTKDGLIKRTPMKHFANIRGSLTAIKLRVCVPV